MSEQAAIHRTLSMVTSESVWWLYTFQSILLVAQAFEPRVGHQKGCGAFPVLGSSAPPPLSLPLLRWGRWDTRPAFCQGEGRTKVCGQETRLPSLLGSCCNSFLLLSGCLCSWVRAVTPPGAVRMCLWGSGAMEGTVEARRLFRAFCTWSDVLNS